jgi:hypothetical protein
MTEKPLDIHPFFYFVLDFPHIFDCFLRLLQAYTTMTWTEETKEMPQKVAKTIQDNQAYKRLIENDPEKLSWYHDYLMSIWKLDIFRPYLDKAITLMCEDLQATRYRPEFRATVLTIFASVSITPHTKRVSFQFL